jgi:phospholipase C
VADEATTTPIKHVIVIIAENRSFDHLFATYRPPAGQTVFNLLSEGIVNEDGTPGPNFAKAAQYSAHGGKTYQPAPIDKTLYPLLPPLMTDGATSGLSEKKPPFLTQAQAAANDSGLNPSDLPLLLSGGTGLPTHSIDTRLPNVMKLPNGPYQLTPGVPYNAYAASPVHRFFQMWQQMDCNTAHASADNPSGCLNDLFPWVEVSVGAGSNGKAPPASFNDQSTGEGSTAMGFYNMARGDAPYLKELAATYAVSDNYHQGVAGGSGANHIMLGAGDMFWFSDGKGNPARPPENQIENPDPQNGVDNYYTQDGYKGGSYVNCADDKAPGVAGLVHYLASLPAKIASHCERDHFYLVNNYAPGYLGNGQRDEKDQFAIPPSSVRTIGDALMEKKISFRYYGEGWNDYAKGGDADLYCNICNFLQYSTSIMKDDKRRRQYIGDLDLFYDDVKNNSLPAVSFIKPSEFNDGHPASSRVDVFEAFAHRLITAVQAQPDLWKDTAILITFDEAGGYWDSGYIQPLDFFGDGPRVPLIVVSPYATGGRVVHSYDDHVSILKFIEHNWQVKPISPRSRDNLPNPVMDAGHPYVPDNSPAIGDLMDMFSF